jgi:glycosyltransferase involved in cell wall biosynthesis
MKAGNPGRVLELRSVWGSGGGPDKTIFASAAGINATKFAVTICYLRDKRDPSYGIARQFDRGKTDYIEVLEEHSFDLKIWSALHALVHERKIDIIHAHDYKTDFYAWMLAKSDRIIPISTAHGWAGHSWKERFIYYPLDRQLLRLYPRILVVSRDIEHKLVKAGVQESKISIVPNAIDPIAFRRQPALRQIVREDLGIRTEKVVIGAIGRLEKEKNYPLLLSAFSKVHARHPEAMLLIAGDGSLKKEIQAQSHILGIEEDCVFLGHVIDVCRLHHALDMLVLCSMNEGSPNAILEAMALQTPVIASNVGGVSDMVRPSIDGLVIRNGDVSELVSAMLEVIHHPDEARQRSTRARQRIESEFTFEARTRRIESIYEELLSRVAECRRSVPLQ